MIIYFKKLEFKPRFNMVITLKKIGFLLLEIVVFLLIVFVILMFFYVFFLILSRTTELRIGNLDSEFENKPYLQSLVSYIPQNITYIAVIYLIRKFIFVRNLDETGLAKQNLISSLWFGFMLGAGLIVIGFIVLFFAGQITMLPTNWNSTLFFGYLLLFFVQSFSEELITRGFLLPAITSRFGQDWGIFLSASIFSLMHFGNSNFTWIGAIGIFLSGIVFGILFYRFNNIWACTGLHWSWNFMQATFFDFNVSGHKVYSFVQFKVSNIDWLSGGGFGFEGSVVSLVLLFMVCVWQGRQLIESRSRHQRVLDPT